MVTVDSLRPGQTLIVSARKIAGGKVALELAEHVQKNVNLLADFNASDSRFQQNKPRRAWLNVEVPDAKRILGLDLSDVTEQGVALNILNPLYNGKRMHIEIVETVRGTEYEIENIETRAKRAGADGPILTHQGHPIFTHTRIVAGEPNHIWLAHDEFETIQAPVMSAEDSIPAEMKGSSTSLTELHD